VSVTECSKARASSILTTVCSCSCMASKCGREGKCLNWFGRDNKQKPGVECISLSLSQAFFSLFIPLLTLHNNSDKIVQALNHNFNVQADDQRAKK